MLETPVPLKNTEVKQHWAWMVLGWVTAWELLVLLTKTKPGLRSCEEEAAAKLRTWVERS